VREILTCDPVQVNFQVLYSDDVSQAMEDAGLHDFPDDLYNRVLQTYQDVAACVVA